MLNKVFKLVKIKHERPKTVISNLVVGGEIYGPKMVNTRWKVVDIKLKEPYAEFLQSQNFEHGREQPSVLELYNFIIETSDHYSNLCKELEAIRSYEPKDEALVMV